MARIAFLLMAHEAPGAIAAKARVLASQGDFVVIHYDARAPAADWQRLCADIRGVPGIALAPRVRCGWGEFSLIRATFRAIETARTRFPEATHHFLISGDCFPTKTRGYIGTWLGEDRDVIETNDFAAGDWIRTGLREDRIRYRHWFNERHQKRLFYGALAFQKRLGLARRPPRDLSIAIGSQWWALRVSTIERIIGFLKGRRDVIRFFRSTWIPDEIFFQTLAAHLVPEEERLSAPPTHLLFSDYGMPVSFHAEHADYLRTQPAPFARKIARGATGLRRDLLARFAEPATPQGGEGGGATGLYAYLAGRGRTGERYAPRFWERAIGPRPGAVLLIIAAKEWHVGRALARAASAITGAPSLGYAFDEDRDPEVDLGNLERGLAKRSRHRMALINTAFDALGTDRLILCLDPARSDAIDEFVEKIGTVRLLLVDRPVGAAHIRSHAQRAGLVGPGSGAFEHDEAAAALARQFEAEIRRLAGTPGGRVHRLAPGRSEEANLRDAARFLGASRQQATALARIAADHAD